MKYADISVTGQAWAPDPGRASDGDDELDLLDHEDAPEFAQDFVGERDA